MKSNVSDHLELMRVVYLDSCIKCTAEVSDLRDLMTIKSRVENEGLSFLTITLPSFCRDFERSLAAGQIDSTAFQGFRKVGAIPSFLRGMLSRIFDQETGRIINEVDTPTVVEAVRQVCLFYKKVQLPCTPERDQAAINNFVEVEHANRSFVASESSISDFREVSLVLWGRMLGVLRLDTMVPRHGPGATAERISGNQKYVWREWYERLEPYFPLLDTAYSSSAHNAEELKKVTLVPEGEERPVRVTLVPKTLKAPRIIAIEPVCMQYAQQALQSALYEGIEKDPLSAGHVNFRDQTINQRLALEASRTGQLATIDLSDASDRVLHDLALTMFDSGPEEIRSAIDACRSRSALLPDGRVVRLAKFASMGSALCFPIEAMYFFTLCVLARLKIHNLPVSRDNCFKVSRAIYVYGDDIIVPADEAVVICDYLSKYNCKVNNAKSFWTGKFRESCGVDAYDGTDVTPVYLRRERPTDLQSVEALASWVATANLFYRKGYWRTASLMYCICERILGDLPYVSPDSALLGRVSFLGYRSSLNHSESLLPSHKLFGCQTLIQRGWKIQEVYSSDNVDGYPALQKCLLSLERRARGIRDISDWGFRDYTSSVVTDPLHLERSARRGAVVLRRRWVSVT